MVTQVTKSTEVNTSTEANKVRVRSWYEEVFNKKKLAAIDDFFAPNVIDHSLPSGAPGGIEGPRQNISMFLGAFPDLHLTLEDIIAEGDKVAVRFTATGTHQGDLMGIAPTGKHVTATGINIIRYENGKSTEGWANFDDLGMLQQLGAIPLMG